MEWRALYLGFRRAMWVWGRYYAGPRQAAPSPDGVRIVVRRADFKRIGFSQPKTCTVKFFGGADVNGKR